LAEVMVRGPAEPQGAHAPSRHPVYAALDLGTNNCRLLVARPAPGGFSVIDSFSRPTRLGEGLNGSGRLSDAAIARTLDALTCCAKRLKRHHGVHLRAVATEACRKAANSDLFIARVRAETGIVMNVIEPEEEARLAATGCRALFDPDQHHALVFDIGGGSTEFAHVRQGAPGGPLTIVKLYSIPIGVVSLTERQPTLSSGVGFAAAVAEIASLLAPFDSDGALRDLALGGGLQMLGTSGTVTILAGMHLGLSRYDRSRVDGLVLDFPDITRMTHQLVQSGSARRALYPCVGRDRADLVVAGCAILEAICQTWPTGVLRVADRGLREGMLLTMLDQARMDRL